MPDNPFANAAQSALQPYARLAQANVALFTDLWFTPEVLTEAYAHTQRLFTPGASASTTEASTDLLTRFTKGLMENYSRFFGELLQASMTLWNPPPYRLTGSMSSGAKPASTASGSAANLPVPRAA